MIQSAVRLSSPGPGVAPDVPTSSLKRQRDSRSPSPLRHRSPKHPRYGNDSAPNGVNDDLNYQPNERFRRLEITQAPRVQPKPPTEEEKQNAAKKEYDALLGARSGGTYIPPARLRALQAQITDKASKEYQRMAWEALKKSINGLVNKVNVSNIKNIVPELFRHVHVIGR